MRRRRQAYKDMRDASGSASTNYLVIRELVNVRLVAGSVQASSRAQLARAIADMDVVHTELRERFGTLATERAVSRTYDRISALESARSDARRAAAQLLPETPARSVYTVRGGLPESARRRH